MGPGLWDTCPHHSTPPVPQEPRGYSEPCRTKRLALEAGERDAVTGVCVCVCNISATVFTANYLLNTKKVT